MSLGGMVIPSFLMKRKPCVDAASSTWRAVSSLGFEMSMIGIVVSLELRLGIFAYQEGTAACS